VGEWITAAVEQTLHATLVDGLRRAARVAGEHVPGGF